MPGGRSDPVARSVAAWLVLAACLPLVLALLIKRLHGLPQKMRNKELPSPGSS